MRHSAPIARFGTCTLFALAVASACGGRSIDYPDDGNGAAPAGGASNVAGTKPTAGTSLGGGVGTGGTGVGATGAVGTGGTRVGAAGSGGYAGEGCTAAPDAGSCQAYQPSWYHDPATGICRPFVFGGCGGNANRYASLADCQRACPLGTPSYDACAQASDCVLAGTGCCGLCDSPDLSRHDFIAYHRRYQGQLPCGSLGAPTPGGGDVACAPCPPVARGSLKYFVPDCVRKECVVVDLRDPQYTSCKTSEQCTVRFGSGCCETSRAEDAIALSTSFDVKSLLCGDTPIDCIPTPIAGFASCSPEGRCQTLSPAF